MRVDALPFVTIAVMACGQVKSNPDGGGGIDASTLDASTLDAANRDAPPAPTPRLRWDFENTTNNSGSDNGFALATPAGISYVTGKHGMAASFGAGQFSNVAGMRNLLGTFAKVTIALWVQEPGNLGATAFLDCNNRATLPAGGVQLGLTNTSVSLCVATTTERFLGGSCLGFTAPSANTFHHWIIRYDGAGTGTGMGGATEVYVDDVLVHTRLNDAANNPVFNTTGMGDTLTIGTPNMKVDDVRIYDRVFTRAEQCTLVIGGTFDGATCTLP